MDDEVASNLPERVQNAELVSPPDAISHLREFEDALVDILGKCGLPSTNIFVPIAERQVVFSNFGRVIERIGSEQRIQSVYFSKFIAAVGSGLFDAALNYLWDETISELRKRVARYDLSYFFDNAVKSQEKRKGLKTEEDLVKIDDSELIYGARGVELISELGFRHLEYIRYMRNWASAAHPNQNEITGLQLITFAETCIKEVLTLPLSEIVIEIKRLLANIRTQILSEQDAKSIGVFFLDLTRDQVRNRLRDFLASIRDKILMHSHGKTYDYFYRSSGTGWMRKCEYSSVSSTESLLRIMIKTKRHWLASSYKSCLLKATYRTICEL